MLQIASNFKWRFENNLFRKFLPSFLVTIMLMVLKTKIYREMKQTYTAPSVADLSVIRPQRVGSIADTSAIRPERVKRFQRLLFNIVLLLPLKPLFQAWRLTCCQHCQGYMWRVLRKRNKSRKFKFWVKQIFRQYILSRLSSCKNDSDSLSRTRNMTFQCKYFKLKT